MKPPGSYHEEDQGQNKAVQGIGELSRHPKFFGPLSHVGKEECGRQDEERMITSDERNGYTVPSVT